MPRISASTRTRWGMIAVAVTLFAGLGGLINRALGHSLEFGLVSAALMGIVVSAFETFYVQGVHGRWLRQRPASQALILYASVITAVAVLSRVVTHLVLGSPADLPRVYARLPATVVFCLLVSGICVAVMRVLRHIGVDTLTKLAFGTYGRPTLKRKLLMFVDMNGSTAFAERLGAFRTQKLFEAFALDLSGPIADGEGAIHLYKGDGLVAVWDWRTERDCCAAVAAVDGMFAALARKEAEYRREFGAVPSFRVGLHGGDVVLSETGDLKRAIGIYGDAINIASRIEEAARRHAVRCCVSDVVVRSLGDLQTRCRLIGAERFRGVQAPMDIYAFEPMIAPLPVPLGQSDAAKGLVSQLAAAVRDGAARPYRLRAVSSRGRCGSAVS